MSRSYLLLWLEGPMQSWGYDSKFSRRDTLGFPTKSGIYGLLLAAMGRSGEQKLLLSELSKMKQEIVCYINSDLDIRSPLLMDFHMVGSGYDEKNSWETLHIPKKADGKSAVGGGSKMTYRYYLQDQTFAVIQELPFEYQEEIKRGIEQPVFSLSLGRKNCIPTEFIYQGIYQSVELAREEAHKLADEKSKILNFRVLEGEHEGENIILNDVPVTFGIKKEYSDRQVTIVS